MNAPIDTLAFVERFQSAGFDPDQARALAAAFSQASDVIRSDLVSKADIDLRLAEFEGRLSRQMAEMELRLTRHIADNGKDMGEIEVRLTRQVADNGKDISGRLWSTVTIIAGVSTAISATVGAAVAMLLKAGGL